MSISSVLNSTLVSNETSSASSSSSSMNQDTFLQILSAQLQYQDPTEGVDSSEYVSQLAQFSSLEAMSNLNTNTQLLLANQMVGKTVAVDQNSDSSVTGVVEGYKISDGDVYITIDGTSYSINDVSAVADTEDSSDSTTDTSTNS